MTMTLKYQIAALLILGFFYAVYIGKMMIQKRQGVVTNQIAKDRSDRKRYRVELLMKIATYSILVVEIISILSGYSLFRYSWKVPGMLLGAAGDLFFLTAVLTMGSSWRAGVAADDHRDFVQKGIFRISRNPAFVGFDLVYLGILCMFFNWFLLLSTIFAMIMLHLQILQEEKYLKNEYGESYTEYRKKVCRYAGRKNWKFLLALLLLAAAVGTAVIHSINSRQEALPEMSFEECIRYTTRNNSDAVITAGIYKDGQMSYAVYGENGQKLKEQYPNYEIGSLTKTMTAALIEKAKVEGLLDLNDSIDQYLDLPKGKQYPSISALLTHTSGYEGYYFNKEMLLNAITGGAPFRYITGDQILKEAGNAASAEDDCEWNYSNFGYALLGQVLESVYEKPYMEILNSGLKEKGLDHTSFSGELTSFGKGWKWELRDAYAPAGAVKSDIRDMLQYASWQLTDESFAEMHQPLQKIENSDVDDTLGIHIDAIGMSWIIDNTNGFVWHNGGTDDFNSYLGFCKKTGTAVVILSNLPDDYRIPATIAGAKLLKEIQ